MDQDALVTEAIDAGAAFLAEFDKSMPVEVCALAQARRVQPMVSVHRASPQVRDTTLDQGYGEVFRLVGRMMNPDLDPLQVKLIPSDTPLARAALEIRAASPSPRPTRLGRKYLGGVVAEAAYIYPALGATPVH